MERTQGWFMEGVEGSQMSLMSNREKSRCY